MKQWVARHFGLVMVIGFLLGLFVPGVERVPDITLLIILAWMMLFSCTLITMEQVKAINVCSAIAFYVLRFLLFPVPVYFVAYYFVPDHAIAFLLLCLAPVGATAAALSGVVRANASLALSFTVVTNVLVPMVIPLYVFYLAGDTIEINLWRLGFTLAVTIFLPVALYFGVIRRKGSAKQRMRQEMPFVTNMALGLFTVIIASMQKELVFGDPMGFLQLLFLSSAFFIVLYAVGFLYALRKNHFDQKTYMLCSGVNNTGLCIGIAALYFSPATVLFLVVADVSWTIVFILFKKHAQWLTHE